MKRYSFALLVALGATSEGVVTVLINSSIGVKRLESEFKESNGTIRCEGMNGSGKHYDSIEIGDGMIT